jgi:nucleotide-binding universal stress UspA family protein
MRTRGQAGIQRAVMGSVAERLLSRSDVPIIMLRPGGRQMDRIANLLVPVDGSPGGALALARGVELAQATGAHIRLVEVVASMAFHTLTPDVATMSYDPAWDDEALRAAQTYVGGMVARLQAAGIVAEGEARTAPDIAGGIVQAADEPTTDLIVMSTHALTGLPRAVLGSVADAVVRTASCPVLLLRRGAQEH